jgi:hypothetical protein
VPERVALDCVDLTTCMLPKRFHKAPQESIRNGTRGGIFLFSDLFCRQKPGRQIGWGTSKGVHFPPSEFTPQTRTEGKRVHRPAGPKENRSGKRYGKMVQCG